MYLFSFPLVSPSRLLGIIALFYPPSPLPPILPPSRSTASTLTPLYLGRAGHQRLCVECVRGEGMLERITKDST